jgi:hypothetical protein
MQPSVTFLNIHGGEPVKKKNRRYDKHPRLAGLLEDLRFIPGDKRDGIISGVMGILKISAPNLLDRYVLDFPLDIKRRRWYDRDPYLWLLINGLRYAPIKLLKEVTHHLQENIGGKTSRNNPACADTKERSILKGKIKKNTGNRKIPVKSITRKRRSR